MFKIPGRDGLYYEKPNWIDKFLRRGNALKDIVPSHMVKMYDPVSKGSKETADAEESDNEDEDGSDDFADSVTKYGKEAKYHHIIKSDGKPGKKLPRYVELENPYPGEPKFLRKSFKILQSQRKKKSSKILHARVDVFHNF